MLRVYGYRGKMLRVDLSLAKGAVHELPESVLKKYLGGRGLCAKLYYDEIPPSVEPLSPQNKLIFATGPLTGTAVFGGSKCALSTKSPCTGIYLCTNAGGFFGAELKFSGYDALVIEGRSEKPVYLDIDEGRVEVRAASRFWGMGTTETAAAIREEKGDKKTQVASIGPAGENLVSFACIMAGERSFGRGGAGAVMGSKNLKAIAVRGTGKVEVARPDELKRVLKEAMPLLKKTTSDHTKYGTAMYFETLYSLGAIPFLNYQQTTQVDADSLFADVLKKHHVKNVSCYSCPVACGKDCKVRSGAHRGAVSKPEYESIWSFGANCGLPSLDFVIAANNLCNEAGLDSITSGSIAGFAMELFQRGIMPNLAGISLRFGDEEGVFELLRRVIRREGIGDLLANGVRFVADAIGKGSQRFAMHVKGLEMTGYEPRAFYGIGLAFATSSRGACHNVGGWTIRDELIEKTSDRFATKGKGGLVKGIQDVRGYVDSTGICTIPRRSLGLTDKPNEEILRYATGLDFTNRLLAIGERVYNLERLILVREGVARKDDDLPLRIKAEPVPDGPAKGKRITQEMLDAMLDEYYGFRGWDSTGKPSPEKMLELDLLEP
ncbi:MAG: aldehyde ferredoxin oxidoreductase family protein [Candidatus Brockarchaeota archaeon]|nr:aldehyde ferredoxin oxidoreductase family protein [Candidatus Brockarchaeota archaeon]